jgi:hypothetical protein
MEALSRRYPGATKKDHTRMEGLLLFLAANGFTEAVKKAQQDAASIQKPEKCAARASILEGEGQRALAKPFRDRQAWLTAGRTIHPTEGDGRTPPAR